MVGAPAEARLETSWQLAALADPLRRGALPFYPAKSYAVPTPGGRDATLDFPAPFLLSRNLDAPPEGTGVKRTKRITCAAVLEGSSGECSFLGLTLAECECWVHGAGVLSCLNPLPLFR